MKEETIMLKSADGRFKIEQEKTGELFTLTIYEDDRSVFSTAYKEKRSYGDLTKTLESYIRAYR